jgi:hypothetical protein
VKPNREDLLQEAAQKALAGVPNVKVQQCMYFSLSSLNASPVRVYVETVFCKVPPRKPGQTIEESKRDRAEWKAQAQADARHAIVAASAVLKEAGFKFKPVEDYGWAQLTIEGGPK